jgi:gamma-glutamylcyclotransferase (GGCT)/AIG2-like uncharacterized protein YtfP
VTVPSKVRLFAYGTLMSGQRDHSILEGAELLCRTQTEARYTLVDIDVYAVLIDDGKTAVHGELYLIDHMHLARVDALRQVPHLFQRHSVTLADASLAEAHFMMLEQVRGKRRLGHGNWLERFAPRNVPHRDRPFAKWARQRSSKS